MKIYPVMDPLNKVDAKLLGVGYNCINQFQKCLKSQEANAPIVFIGAVNTGEFRRPKKGEWFLSGAVGEAYRAPNDVSKDYYIGKLVKFKKVTTMVIVK